MTVFNVSTSTELQSALTTAQDNGSDDVIQIAQGTYSGNFLYVSTEDNNLSILGGYSANFSSREIDSSNTILDGGGTNRVLTLMSTTALCDYEIEGLTVQNGDSLDEMGGGIAIRALGDVSISSNHIVNNIGGWAGGGVFIVTDYNATVEKTSSVELNNNNISYNSSPEINGNGGGGVYILYGNPVLSNNVISNNVGNGVYGGGGVSINSADATLINNVIYKNSTTLGNPESLDGGGGGVKINSNRDGSLVMIGNTIVDNFATSYGGGISWYPLESQSAIIENNIIRKIKIGKYFIKEATT